MNYKMIEDRYLRDNKFLGRLVGLWPDQDKRTRRTIQVAISFIIMLSNAAQIAQIIVNPSFEMMTDQMPFLALGFGVIFKQYNYIVNENLLRDLLHGIVSDWLVKRPKEELAILEIFCKRAMLFSFVYKVSIYFCLFTFLLLPAIPPILDVIAPLNESRKHVFLYPSYYFVDEQQYYYPIQGHMTVSAFILAFVYIACDINLVHTVQHACALFAISGYRFKHSMENVDFSGEKYNCKSTIDKSYGKVTASIDAHKRAIEYVEKIEACHVHYLFFLTGLVIMAFTVTFIKLASMEMGTMYMTFCTFTVAQLIHLFFLTIMGQFVINSNEETFQNICETQWYLGSTKAQALYVLVMRKCLSPPKLTAGGLISLNLDSFLQILKASFSYYTVLKTS